MFQMPATVIKFSSNTDVPVFDVTAVFEVLAVLFHAFAIV